MHSKMSASHKGYFPQESTASLTLQTTLLTMWSFSSISEGRHSSLNSISQTGRPSLNFKNRSVPKYPTQSARIVSQRNLSRSENRSVSSPRLLRPSFCERGNVNLTRTFNVLGQSTSLKANCFLVATDSL